MSSNKVLQYGNYEQVHKCTMHTSTSEDGYWEKVRIAKLMAKMARLHSKDPYQSMVGVSFVVCWFSVGGGGGDMIMLVVFIMATPKEF